MAYTDGNDENKIEISGTVDSVIFQSEDSGYTVLELEDEDGFPQTLVGTMPYVTEGDHLTAAGRWTFHPTYGKQLKVEIYEKTMPSSEKDILRYLASGALKGIGKKTAERLVSTYGDQTFDVIENHPEWLADLPGISKKKAFDISENFTKMSGARNVMVFCADYFSSATSMKIYRKWGGSAVDRIRSNPYSLCESFNGIGFKKADLIAQGCGLSSDSRDRISAGIVYALTTASHSFGHTCLPKDTLINDAAKLLSLDEKLIHDNLGLLCASGKILQVRRNDESFFYLPRYRRAEIYCAEKLKELLYKCPSVSFDDIDAFIKKIELQSGIKYALKQREAVTSALRGGVMILTGGPGTGKTTVIKALLSIFDTIGLNCALAAPTGRAAKRMSEACGYEAKTVHRLLEMERTDNDEPRFAKNEKELLEENAVIIDESSMLDILLLEALLKAVKPGSRIIFIGDKDQLPSVGAGNVLADLIKSAVFPTVSLTEIFRQSEDSLIITNAHLINEGKMPVFDNSKKDFFFMRRYSDRDIAETVADLVANRLPKAYGKEAAEGIQVITPSRKGEAGTVALNILLQQKLNPPEKKKKEKEAHGIILRMGDRVMQNKNDYTVEWEKDGLSGLGIFNGDIGTLYDISPGDGTMSIDFDGRDCLYDIMQTDELEHAYAITVHKSQGSEYPIVIIPLYSCAPMLLTRNLIYTAITRASKIVILVGREDILYRMVENNHSEVRYSLFADILKKADDE